MSAFRRLVYLGVWNLNARCDTAVSLELAGAVDLDLFSATGPHLFHQSLPPRSSPQGDRSCFVIGFAWSLKAGDY